MHGGCNLWPFGARRCCLLALLAMSLTVWAGCDFWAQSEGMRITGEVSYDGQPVEEGAILLTPIDGGSGAAAGGEISHGRYEIAAGNGPVPGRTYRVELTALRGTGEGFPLPDGGTMELKTDFIPPAYNRESTLKITVSEDRGKNEFNFRLKRPE